MRFALLVFVLVSIPCGLEATTCVASRYEVGRIQGVVVADASPNAVLPGAEIVLQRRGGGHEVRASADHEGFFSFGSVPEGHYFIRATLPGYQSAGGYLFYRNDRSLDYPLLINLTTQENHCSYMRLQSVRQAQRLQRKGLQALRSGAERGWSSSAMNEKAETVLKDFVNEQAFSGDIQLETRPLLGRIEVTDQRQNKATLHAKGRTHHLVEALAQQSGLSGGMENLRLLLDGDD